MRISLSPLKITALILAGLVLVALSLSLYREWTKRQVVPRLIGTSLSDDTEQASLLLDLTLYFDHDIKWSEEKLSISPTVNLEVTQPNSQSVRIFSIDKLSTNTTYSIEYSYQNRYGWKRQQGNLVFTTRGTNQITQRSPATDDTTQDLTTPVSLTFLYPPVPGTIEYQISPARDASLSYTGSSVIVAPVTVWEPGTSYRVNFYPNALTREEDTFSETSLSFTTFDDTQANAVYLETLEEENRYNDQQQEAETQALGDEQFSTAGEELKRTNPEIRLRSELPYVQSDWSMQYLYSTDQYVIIYSPPAGETAARAWLESIGFTPDNVLWVEQ